MIKRELSPRDTKWCKSEVAGCKIHTHFIRNTVVYKDIVNIYPGDQGGFRRNKVARSSYGKSTLLTLRKSLLLEGTY